MNYKETIVWLFSQLPMFQRVGKAAYKADLKTTVDLLNALGNPQEKFKAIHVAGTNGKGSVCHLLASILQEAGYKTGLYTSPHLKDFRERIRLNGKVIPQERVVEFVKTNQKAFDKLKPSFFEMTVGMAYNYFADEQVDFAVLETGMGGRLDSTNISNPIVTVITNIGYDHQQFLGDELIEIAREKAGIIKQNIPLVVGKKQVGVKDVFEEVASQKNAAITYTDDHFEFRKIETTNKSQQLFDIWLDGELFLEKMDSPLLANYQAGNMATTLQTVSLLQESGLIQLTSEIIRNGMQKVLENTGLQGRWQTLSSNPLTICDTGHNPEGIQAVIEQIGSKDFEHLHFVFGMVNDKSPETILYLLPKHATYYFCKADIPRGMNAVELKEAAFKAGLRGQSFNSVTDAYNSAINNAGVNDLVFVGGSTFVVAEVL
ncbi:MAG: bifunctional folylpolyglutamate synthase/dihydrofolate synthase [Bacteroidetes bacterium]|nr:MAG: bifunctional folylpolyglutamate synthase/dihydrofolate synthase [Bacteroidota bacterium]